MKKVTLAVLLFMFALATAGAGGVIDRIFGRDNSSSTPPASQTPPPATTTPPAAQTPPVTPQPAVVADPLNGTWVQRHDAGDEVFTFNNGNWTFSYITNGVGRSVENVYRGTYTTGGGKMTFTVTHCHSAWTDDLAGNYGIPEREYTQSQLEAAIRASERGKTMSEEEIRTLIGSSFSFLGTFDYSLSGNTLTLGPIGALTKR
jgi:hypothetical protein